MKDRSFNSIEDRVAHLREVNATLLTRLQEVEADAAVMRVALSKVVDIVGNSTWKGYVDKDWPGFKITKVVQDALATNAGKALLERLQEAEWIVGNVYAFPIGSERLLEWMTRRDAWLSKK